MRHGQAGRQIFHSKIHFSEFLAFDFFENRVIRVFHYDLVAYYNHFILFYSKNIFSFIHLCLYIFIFLCICNKDTECTSAWFYCCSNSKLFYCASALEIIRTYVFIRSNSPLLADQIFDVPSCAKCGTLAGSDVYQNQKEFD